MDEKNLLKKIQDAGFENLEEFVKANLHYLPEEKQSLFYTLNYTPQIDYQEL